MIDPRAGESEWTRIKEADRVNRARGRADAEQRARDLAAAATPQTLHKRRVSVVAELFERGQLGAEQVQAAEEIAAVRYALTAAVQAKVARYGAGGGGGVLDWQPGLTRAYRERYCPWARETEVIGVGRGLSLFTLVSFVVVDNMGLRQVRERLHARHETCKRLLQEGLYRYGELAGWFSQRPGGLRGVEIVTPAENAA